LQETVDPDNMFRRENDFDVGKIWPEFTT
jgi:hypothetical protein